MKPSRAASAAFLAIMSATAVSAVAPGTLTTSRTSPGPVVVELFQSQGCSDCPPAQANLNKLAERPGVLALSYGVTYWDKLGWKDSFASPQFTQRQYDYSNRNGGNGVATPQYWINGRRTVVGANPAAVDQAIAAGAPTGGPSVRLSPTGVVIGAASAPNSADIWLVRYDPRTIQVAIRAGENGGRTIPHRDIVRELTRIGHWTGAAETLRLPAATDGLDTAILIQAGTGGPIIAAARS